MCEERAPADRHAAQGGREEGVGLGAPFSQRVILYIRSGKAPALYKYSGTTGGCPLGVACATSSGRGETASEFTL